MATDAEIGKAVVLLLAPYESRERSNGADELRLVAYVQALQGFPLWAIHDAVLAWSRGEHPEPGDNRAFAPAPPQIVRLVQIAMREPEEALAKADALLAAEVEEPLPAQGERERVEAGFVALAAELGEGIEEERKKALDMQREHIKRGNEIARQREFAAHGIEYKSGSLDASPTLLEHLAGRCREAAE